MPITDVTPPDYSTTLGQVRLLIPDTEQLLNPANPSATAEYLFNDSQVTAFLSLYASNVKKAAAQAKLVLATSESLINKVIKTGDYATDGAKLGAELRAQAAELRIEAEKDEMEDSYEEISIVSLLLKPDNSWL
jgi:hypothetical protein